LRHSHPELLDGEYVALNQSDANVISYLRKGKDRATVVALNLSAEPQTVSFDLAAQNIKAQQGTLLLSSAADAAKEVDLKAIKLAPFGVMVTEVR
jgi:alpha-glucosidase